MRLAISLPTRGRPEKLIDTISRSVANWKLDTTVMYIMADKDDPATIEAFWKAHKRWNDGRLKVILSVEEREDTIAAKWNRVLQLDKAADVYLTDADDAPQITPGYDEKILAAAERFPDGIGCVYGHMANASFTCSESMTNKWVRQLGYIFPEYFPYWFVDHWIDDLAKMTGRISFADIRTDQSAVGKTMEFREPGWWATWFDAAYLMRRTEAERIIRALDDEPWRKDMLKAQFPLIEYRSRWINDNVRVNERNMVSYLGAGRPDERYTRIKDKAVGLISHLLEGHGMSVQQAAAYRNVLQPPPVPNLARAFA